MDNWRCIDKCWMNLDYLRQVWVKKEVNKEEWRIFTSDREDDTILLSDNIFTSLEEAQEYIDKLMKNYTLVKRVEALEKEIETLRAMFLTD